MKILQIKESDVDCCSDALYASAEEKFRTGNFTYIESEGSINEVAVIEAGVFVGEVIGTIES